MSGCLVAFDYAIIFVYVAAVLAVGFWAGRRVKNDSDFFLAGRRLPWWAVGFSLVATDIGATDLIGGGGAAYRTGLAIANFEWIGCIPAMIVGAFVFVPFFHRLGIYTIPEYMERRYNGTMRGVLAVVILASMAFNLGIMLFASARLMAGLAGGPELGWVVAIAAIAGCYTVAGGLAAEVYNDVLQCVVMIVGCLAVGAYGIAEVGGVGELVARVRAIDTSHTELLLPADTTSPYPWSGLLFGLALVLSPSYWIANQAIVQRSLGTRSAEEARASYVAGALLKTVIPFIYVIPGLVALVKYPGLANGDLAVPRLAAELLPAGMRGLFVAAFLAALISTVDSYLNSASTVFVRDLYLRFIRPTAAEAQQATRARVTTFMVMVVAVGVGMWLSGLQDSPVYSIFQTLMAFSQGPILAVLLAGLFWRRATAAGAVSGFLAGVGTSAALFAMNLEGVCRWLDIEPLFRIREPFLYFSVWSFASASAVLAVVSLCGRRPPEDKLTGGLYRP